MLALLNTKRHLFPDRQHKFWSYYRKVKAKVDRAKDRKTREAAAELKDSRPITQRLFENVRASQARTQQQRRQQQQQGASMATQGVQRGRVPYTGQAATYRSTGA